MCEKYNIFQLITNKFRFRVGGLRFFPGFDSVIYRQATPPSSIPSPYHHLTQQQGPPTASTTNTGFVVGGCRSGSKGIPQQIILGFYIICEFTFHFLDFSGRPDVWFWRRRKIASRRNSPAAIQWQIFRFHFVSAYF